MKGHSLDITPVAPPRRKRIRHVASLALAVLLIAFAAIVGFLTHRQ